MIRVRLRFVVGALLLLPPSSFLLHPFDVWGAAAEARIPPNDPRLMLFGRWDQRAADRAITVNTGSEIVVRFSGTRLTFFFDTSIYKHEKPTVTIRLDELGWEDREVAERMEVATSGPATQEHVARLVARGFREWDNRWSPPLESALIFLGVTAGSGGQLLAPPPRPRWQIEFLGDSITEGVLTMGRGPQSEWPRLSDGRRAYAFQTAELLNAAPFIVGFGRLGITVGGNGGVPRAIESFPFVYQDVPKERLQPVAVVIALGANDAKAKADQFLADYLDYVAAVREAYPVAHIFCMRPLNGTHAKEILAAVERLAATDDKKVHYADTSGWIDPKTDTTDGLHPNVEGHRCVAEKLAVVIQQVLSERTR
jgi:lysophospholipase L1-like esterase